MVTSVPRPAPEWTSSRPLALLHEILEQAQAEARAVGGACAAGSKPRPSSRTASTTEPFERLTLHHHVGGVRVLGDVAQRLLRAAEDQLLGLRGEREVVAAISASTAIPRAESGASRSETAASSPER